MGEAKRRKSEIEEMLRMTPEQRQRHQDKARLLHGIDPLSPDPAPVASMARVLKGMFEDAKVSGDIDATVTFLHSMVNATVRGSSDVSIACKKGCSHCCYTWVSVSAPEALFISKIVASRGNSAVEKVRFAHQQTEYDFEARDQHPFPCPLLEDDACSIYDSRPKVCRLAASGDAGVCGRAYHNLSNENIPMPMVYLAGRSVYSIALAVGLRKAGLPYRAYELNSALVCAIDATNAERRWLSGEDIFASALGDPADIFLEPQAQRMYEYAFS